MNLIASFMETAGRMGQKTAIVSGRGETISFADLACRSEAFAAAWQDAGLRAGDKVLIAMPVDINLYAAIAGLWHIGATIVLPEPALGLAGLKHAAKATRPKAFLANGFYKHLRFILSDLWRIPLKLDLNADISRRKPIADLPADHPALISFTSGSTGTPKAIQRSHSFLAAQNACLCQFMAPKRDDETDLVAFPVFVVANLGQGVTSVLPNWKLTRQHHANVHAIGDLITKQKVTRALLPPSICSLMAASDVTPGLDTIMTGGGPVFPDLLQRLLKRLPKTSIVSVYGSTEAEPIAHQHAETITDDQWHQMKTGKGLLAGKPVPEIRLQILDDEILVTGDHVNKGYLDSDDDASTKLALDDDIWHRTGDSGRLDDDGILWLRGRHSAKAGDFFPFEVEAVARGWKGVDDAALIPGSNTPTLALSGREPSPGTWQAEAAELGTLRVIPLKAIPMDRRHRSKVDYRRLQSLTKSR